MKGKNIIVDKSFQFALDIIELYKELKANNEFILSKQLLRAGTSIGANVEEAIAAVSKRDFINKMAISSKEVRESKYWLKLLEKSQIVKLDYKKYIYQTDELIKILTSIVKTSQENK